MDEARRKQLEAAGYRVSDVQEFLGLSDAEMAYIDMRIAIRKALRARREAEGITQKDLATRLGSSQSRVAKIEAGDPSVSLDLLIRALLATGATVLDIADAIAPERAQVA
ncbi:helix-turn-helix transcriptional regulator [Longimicrobium sp.]|uniref:helix-turn-helix transcriptional regulator n=1 Tax=Longimicrobium sp. TaxID=2029185 RepID=UPI003B3ACCFE